MESRKGYIVTSLAKKQAEAQRKAEESAHEAAQQPPQQQPQVKKVEPPKQAVQKTTNAQPAQKQPQTTAPPKGNTQVAGRKK